VRLRKGKPRGKWKSGAPPRKKGRRQVWLRGGASLNVVRGPHLDNSLKPERVTHGRPSEAPSDDGRVLREKPSGGRRPMVELDRGSSLTPTTWPREVDVRSIAGDGHRRRPPAEEIRPPGSFVEEGLQAPRIDVIIIMRREVPVFTTVRQARKDRLISLESSGQGDQSRPDIFNWRRGYVRETACPSPSSLGSRSKRGRCWKTSLPFFIQTARKRRSPQGSPVAPSLDDLGRRSM